MTYFWGQLPYGVGQVNWAYPSAYSVAPSKPEDRFGPSPDTVPYSWFKMDEHIHCYIDPDNICHIGLLLEAKRLSKFHDAELESATKDINSILHRIHKNNKDPNRKLVFLTTNKGIFLAWVTRGNIIGPNNPKASEALGLE